MAPERGFQIHWLSSIFHFLVHQFSRGKLANPTKADNDGKALRFGPGLHVIRRIAVEIIGFLCFNENSKAMDFSDKILF
jgi:hypothetical protein